VAKRFWPVREYHANLLKEETGWVKKEPGGRLNVALLYPNTYQVGLANLGLAVVYDMLNQRADTFCERAFLPDRAGLKIQQKAKAPLLTLESCRPLDEFDLILASISFENDYPHLVRMLEMAGLEPWADKRTGPPIIAGGVAMMLNPEPLALLMDGFLLGEAEVILDPFIQALKEAPSDSKEDFLLHLSKNAPGFYAPVFYTPDYHEDGRLKSFKPSHGLPKRVSAPKYTGPAKGMAQSVFQAKGPELADMKLLEVGRGCGHGCRFCAAGHIYRPPRLGHADDFMEPALAAAKKGDKIGLVCAAASDLEGIDDLAAEVIRLGGKISVSSLRADRLGDDLVKALAQSRHQTVALAPEAGSPRLRRIINKHLTEKDLAKGVEKLIQGGVPNIRLYFMVGLPEETDEDISEMIGLIKRIRQQVVSLSRARGHLGRVTISMNAFIPKPWTPFQWQPMAPLKTVKQRMNQVKKELAGMPNLKVVADVPKYARLQAVLSRGDRRLAPLLLALAKDPNPQRAFNDLNLDAGFYADRMRDEEELFPWDFVDHKITKNYLLTEAKRAMMEKQSPDCNPAKCTRCGVCGNKTG
jgi:radical SAM superfamily enzyme YgiQ (UPF0313 family)